MRRNLASTLRESVEVAEAQLAAARSLDSDALRVATERRQDLVFELERYSESEMKAAGTEETRDLALDLAELDQRLGRILAAALDTFERLQPPQSSRTYSADGRMRETVR